MEPVFPLPKLPPFEVCERIMSIAAILVAASEKRYLSGTICAHLGSEKEYMLERYDGDLAILLPISGYEVAVYVPAETVFSVVEVTHATKTLIERLN